MSLPAEAKSNILNGNYVPALAKITETGSVSYRKLNAAGRSILGNKGKLPEL